MGDFCKRTKCSFINVLRNILLIEIYQDFYE